MTLLSRLKSGARESPSFVFKYEKIFQETLNCRNPLAKDHQNTPLFTVKCTASVTYLQGNLRSIAVKGSGEEFLHNVWVCATDSKERLGIWEPILDLNTVNKPGQFKK